MNRYEAATLAPQAGPESAREQVNNKVAEYMVAAGALFGVPVSSEAIKRVRKASSQISNKRIGKHHKSTN